MTEPSTESSKDAVVRTLLLTDLVDSTKLVEKLGDVRAADVAEHHDRLARDLLARFDGREIDKTDGFLLLFERPADAVRCALAYHHRLNELSVEEGVQIRARAGVHMGEVVLRENSPDDVARGAKPLEVEGLAKPTAARIMSLAGAQQTLVSAAVFFNLARSTDSGKLADRDLRWLAHGPYLFKGVEDPVDIFEIGEVGFAPLSVPPDSDKARRVVAAGDELTLGWRPAPGDEIPRRPNWIVKERLGEGGFGEVWLAEQKATGERRVFKFCYEVKRLRALQREVTLFRLLKEALGNRDDIVRIVDWNFEESPYFLESEHTAGGNLGQWAESQGGIGEVPMATRLELVAQVAEALSAAHSVGVLHKDIKPSNVLIHTAAGRPQARLTDFGIGLLTRQDVLLAKGITVMGMTELLPSPGTPSATGGTQMYMGPELLEGKPATVQADIYALGVLAYQMVVGDLSKALAPGWRRDLEDELLANDLAGFVDGDPAQRPGSALEVARRLRSLEERRERLEAERREREEAEAARLALERAHRRRRVLTVISTVSTVVLVVVTVLAVFSVRAKREAIEARQVADSRRDQAEDLISFMLGDLREKLTEVGRLEILDDVGDEALRYFAAVPEEELTDEELVRRSSTLKLIGQVRFYQGKSAEALEALNQAVPIARRLAEKDPGNLDWQIELWFQYSWIGRIYYTQRNLDEAAKHFRLQLSVMERCAEKFPENADVLLKASQASNNLGFVQEAMGHLREALESRKTSQEIKRGLFDQDTAGEELKDSFANGLNALGALYWRLGELNAALRELNAEREIREDLLKADPESSQAQRYLLINHIYMGRLLEAKGEAGESELHFKEAVAQAQALVELDGSNSAWKGSLASACLWIGRFLQSERDWARAEDYLQEGLRLLEGLVEKDSTIVRWKEDLAACLISLGEIADAKRDSVRAEALADRGIAMLKGMAGPDTDGQEAGRSSWWLGEGYLLKGKIASGAGRVEEMRTYLHEARSLFEGMGDEAESSDVVRPLIETLFLLGREEAAREKIEEMSARGYDVSRLRTLLGVEGS